MDSIAPIDSITIEPTAESTTETSSVAIEREVKQVLNALSVIYQVGPPGGSGGYSVSWLMAIDYLALTAYMVALAVAFFGWRSIPKIVTGIVVSAGMMIFLLIDAWLPYGKSWFLQLWAIFIVAAVSFIMRGLGFPVFGAGNSLTIIGANGVWHLLVFWQSVGVESMLIFSLVMIVYKTERCLLSVMCVEPTRKADGRSDCGCASSVRGSSADQ